LSKYESADIVGNQRKSFFAYVDEFQSFAILRAEDAPYLAREFVGQFDEIDLVQLPNYRIYLKLMIDGSPSRPFSGVTLMPDPDPTSHV
jgi:hypothetical protein